MHSNYFHGSNIGLFRPRSPNALDAYHPCNDIQVDSGRYTESDSSNSPFPSQSWDFQVNIAIWIVCFSVDYFVGSAFILPLYIIPKHNDIELTRKSLESYTNQSETYTNQPETRTRKTRARIKTERL